MGALAAALLLAAPAHAGEPERCAELWPETCVAAVDPGGAERRSEPPAPADVASDATSTCAGPAEIARRRVLLIGVDGVRADALQVARAPHLAGLARAGTASWDAEVADVTLSGPSWTALLTGVGADKHGVWDNAFSDHRLADWPTVFDRLRGERPDTWLGAFVAWRPLRERILPGEALDRNAWRSQDESVTVEAARALRTKDAHLTFVHLDAVDAAGHRHGYGPDNTLYLRAIEAADAQVGRLLAAIERRPTRSAEDWLVVVTTDHGGTGFGHRDDLPDNRRVFVIASGLGPAGSAFTRATPRLTDVAPTILAFLGVPLDADADLDGQPLVADAGPRPLAACPPPAEAAAR